jgi:hypothetical protein
MSLAGEFHEGAGEAFQVEDAFIMSPGLAR